MTGLQQSRLLALAVSGGLLGGAYVSQYGFGLFPCEMCWWQRYPHFAALALALVSFLAAPQRVWVALAGLAILTSGLIGGFHAGVEYGWWEGITGCSTMPSGIDVMDVSAAPLIRCDVAPWTLFGISLAGFNFLFSCVGGAAVVALAAYRK
ncbi:disulfide bond formation protein [Erythrobacter sp. JL475]|nr:disulfide bond formation protein [Erythrobacter sp. JL475]